MNKKKIMIIEPPFYRLYHDQFCLVKYPLALGYLSGSIIKNTDWTVKTYNADFNTNKHPFDPDGDYVTGEGFQLYLSALKDPTMPIWQEVRDAISEFNPSVVGISVKSQNFTSGSIVAKITKEINPHIKVIVGGAHATMNGETLFNTPNIDFVTVGEGENTIVDFLKAIDSGSDFNKVDGIIFRKDNKLTRTKPRKYIEDLDSLDFPLKHVPDVLKDFEKYPKRAFAYIFGSRGCPYACTFCESKAMWTRKVRYRSPENIVAEMKQMKDFGISSVNFDDDTFGISKKNIKAINNLLHNELPDMTYTCETVVQLAKDEEVVKDMKKGGCTGTYVGIESGNNEMLKTIKKTQTTDECVLAIRNLQKNGIDAHAFIMVGFPTETEETFKQTMDFLPVLKPDNIIFSVFTPYPGSDLFFQCKKDGLIGEDFDLSKYNHQSPLNCFTKNISRDRFYQLRGEATKFVDSYNQKAKFRRGFAALRNLGLKQTLKKVYNHYYSKIIAKVNTSKFI